MVQLPGGRKAEASLFPVMLHVGQTGANIGRGRPARRLLLVFMARGGAFFGGTFPDETAGVLQFAAFEQQCTDGMA
ncbi:hypothetical protein D0B54_18595 [Solimonas sp. K1W22B-7]|nr:hypothetical protein D0B54_18595 [Solimonas sp. K1W22B-7]